MRRIDGSERDVFPGKNGSGKFDGRGNGDEQKRSWVCMCTCVLLC